MDYNDINTFLTIATSDSLTQAADSLFISQPALSHRLRNLEQELDCQLIIRQKGIRSIQLTEAGKRFLPLARRWQELWQETNHLHLDHPLTPLRVSNVDSLNVSFMPQVYPEFMRTHPQCKLSISTLRSNAAYHAVEAHEVDIALITNPHFFRKIKTIPLFHEAMKFVCCPQSDYPDTVTPKELHLDREVYIPWSNPFLLWHEYWFGTTEDQKISLDNMSLFQSFLQLKNTWAIVPSSYAHAMQKKGQVRICNITDGPDARTCYLIYDEQWPKPTLMNDFIESVLSAVAGYDDVELDQHTQNEAPSKRQSR